MTIHPSLFCHARDRLQVCLQFVNKICAHPIVIVPILRKIRPRSEKLSRSEETVMLDFQKFMRPMAQQFKKMSAHTLFRVRIERDELWTSYLNAFPEGTNPIFKKRSEYDCSCCRHFVKLMGGVIAVIDGDINSLWDITTDEPV